MLVRPTVVVIPGLIILGFGICLSFAGFTSAFQRSGAVLVVYALLVFGWARERNSTTRKKFATDSDLLPLTPSERERYRVHDGDDIKESVVKAFKTVGVYDKAETGLKRSEIWMGVIGTLVWGFGDLPFIEDCPTC